MAEILVSEFSKFVLRQLSSVVVKEVKLALGLEDELDRIKSNLSSIQAVLRDAEKQQSTSESVQIWLHNLQDVMYDIDDLLDEIATEVTIQDKNKDRLLKQVRKFFSRDNSLVLRSQWAHQIKNLRKRLDWIKDERTSLVLFPEVADPLDSSSSRETYAKVNQTEILGRDQDKEAIINLILNSRDCASLSVLPIVGFGGVGKSTLAKLIYSDYRIDESFDKKLWVYVSEKFMIKKILNQILSLVTGEDVHKLIMERCSLEQLRIKISMALQNNKYILMLDDFWNENSNEWRRLKELLDVGAKGSMVVVTTRDLKVASMVKSAADEYTLRELSSKTCLRIFKQLAFKDDEKIAPALWNLAKSIVNKSRGLPLLVTTLGNLLREERDEREWHHVIRKLEQGHEDILSVLKLSYDQLPSYLKLSFRICSVWGKGAKINPWFHLTPFLMALGFLPHDVQGEPLEYIGSKCINELLSKSLLQKLDHAVHDMFSVICMHDFVHDLAQSMAGDELAIINYSTKEVSEKVRYIRMEEEDSSGKQCHESVLSKAKKTRLLLINPSEHSISKALMESIMSNLKCLRVLHLRSCQFEELPRSIGNLKHLRYINLVGNVGIKKLPNSICNLFNLQTLLLGGCSNLQKLPADIGKLENLRCFSITTQQEFLPESIGLLNALRALVLYECPRLVCLPNSTNALKNLDSCWITGCNELDLAHGSWSHKGLNSLRFLSINHLPKFTRLPIREMDVSFTSLETLEIEDCEGLIELTDWIEHLTSHSTLFISGCSNLVGLPRSFYLLDQLKWLSIYSCPILEERFTPGTGHDWHLISNIPLIEIDGERIN